MSIRMNIRKIEEVTINGKPLRKILNDHELWLYGSKSGNRAVLDNADLSNVDLSGVDLGGASLNSVNFRNTNLSEANLSNADLYRAFFTAADISNTNLENALLRYAIFEDTNFDGANLAYATFFLANIKRCNFSNSSFICTDFSCANIQDTNFVKSNIKHSIFTNANFTYVSFIENTIAETSFEEANLTHYFKFDNDDNKFRTGKILTDNIIGYKICEDDEGRFVVVTVEIPEGAIVFSINGKKCRTNKAKVIAIDGARAFSLYKKYMSYYVGDEFNIKDFDCRYNIECAEGIHFYLTREEAEEGKI